MMDSIEASRQLTENLYYIIGVSVVSGLGAIIAGVSFAFKKVIWIAKLEFRLERMERDLNAAFEKLRDQETLSREILKKVDRLSENVVRYVSQGKSGED